MNSVRAAQIIEQTVWYGTLYGMHSSLIFQVIWKYPFIPVYYMFIGLINQVLLSYWEVIKIFYDSVTILQGLTVAYSTQHWYDRFIFNECS